MSTIGHTTINDQSAIEQLDSVLNIFYDNYKSITLHGIPSLLEREGFLPFKRKHVLEEADTEEHINRIVGKLVKDGYVSSPVAGGNGYSITFNGMTFKEAGGYASQDKRQVIKAILEKINVWLVASAAFAATGYYLRELLKSYLNFSLDLKSCLILLFFGIGVGIIILLVIQELVRRKSR